MIVADELLEHARGKALIADTGYDSNRYRQAIRDRKMKPVIGSKPERPRKLPKSRARPVWEAIPGRGLLSQPQALSRYRHPVREDRAELPCPYTTGLCAALARRKLGTPPSALSQKKQSSSPVQPGQSTGGAERRKCKGSVASRVPERPGPKPASPLLGRIRARS